MTDAALSPQSPSTGWGGIRWAELAQAYRVFLSHPTDSIHHILVAGQDSAWQQWVHRRWVRQAGHLQNADLTIDLAQLAQLPADTLGGAYARHMLQLGLDPDEFFRDGNAQTDWIGRRASLCHDVHHIITGFDASSRGEFGVAAFNLVQYGNLLNVFVLSFLPLQLMRDPLSFWAVLRGIWLGIRCNQPIFGYAFEQRWQVPLREVRHELGL